MTWNIIGASHAGTHHLAHAIPCQDAHTITHITLEHAVIAIADGVGSAPHAAFGAAIATHSLTTLIADTITRNAGDTTAITHELPAIVRAVRNAITIMAAVHATGTIEATANDFATTLLAAIITPTHLLTLQIGDGAIITMHKDNTLNVLSTQQTKEYANDVTGITAHNYTDHLNVTTTDINTITAIALCTDGIESISVTRATNAAINGFYKPIITAATNNANPGLMHAILQSPHITSRTNDDRTLVIATRRTTP